MNIGIIGTGYVGLVSGTCFAETGNKVMCIDIQQEKIESLKNGQLTIYEPGLEKLFHRNISEGRLKFCTDLSRHIDQMELIFLALPTPPNEDGSADLKYVLQVATQIGTLIKDYKIIINKSTVPVGTVNLVREKIAENYHGEFDVISNPEFLREGFAVDDFMKPDRVVIGVNNNRPIEKMKQLYEPYLRQGNPLIFMDCNSAELTKYAANAFLATKISFMNEIANLCDKVGADVDQIRRGISFDERIGKRFLFPGIGYGGSCFPKDVKALINIANSNDYSFKILKSVEEVNKRQKLIIVEQILNHFKDIAGLKFALWGLSFKPNTDDIREAPAIEIIKKLINHGAQISAFDPEAKHNVAQLNLGTQFTLANDQYEALQQADALIIATEWNEFRNPDYDQMKTLLKSATIFDGRNIFNKSKLHDLGFIYYSIGRP
ncbi:MAG: UDP-glucose/GDP-mannose dehydrogenase family protein [Sediminibacterium sp.]|nr:UDP-glucose/GDP-mannose dehydrogenase family protein [Sediminibacterium sp.]